jgi:hypothetical protein
MSTICSHEKLKNVLLGKSKYSLEECCVGHLSVDKVLLNKAKKISSLINGQCFRCSCGSWVNFKEQLELLQIN